MRRNPNISNLSLLPKQDLSLLSRLEKERHLNYVPIDLNSNKITIDSYLSVDNCTNITNEYKRDLCSLLSKYESLIITEKKSIDDKDRNNILTTNIIKELILILISIVKFRYIIIILETINKNINKNINNRPIIEELYINNSLEYTSVVSTLINIFKRKSEYVDYNIHNPNTEETQRKLKYTEYKNILETNFDTSEHFIEYIEYDTLKCSELINKIIYYIKNELSEQYKQLKEYYIDNPQIDIDNQDKIVSYYFNKYNLKSEIEKISKDFDVYEQNRPSTVYYKKYLKYKQKYLEYKQKYKEQINQ